MSLENEKVAACDTATRNENNEPYVHYCNGQACAKQWFSDLLLETAKRLLQKGCKAQAKFYWSLLQ